MAIYQFPATHGPLLQVQPPNEWKLAIEGHWSQSPYHSGHIAYYVGQSPDGSWLLKSLDRYAELDGLTEEDVEEGRLNDDQVQALWGTTLAAAQALTYEEVVAVWTDPPTGISSTEAAAALYKALRGSGRPLVEEPNGHGLLG